jgi:hypothetical protein
MWLIGAATSQMVLNYVFIIKLRSHGSDYEEYYILGREALYNAVVYGRFGGTSKKSKSCSFTRDIDLFFVVSVNLYQITCPQIQEDNILHSLLMASSTYFYIHKRK